MIDLKQGDCLELMKDSPDGSVDLILTDIPYLCGRKTNFKTIKDYTKKSGETKYSCMDFGEWDKAFDLEKFVSESIRVLKKPSSMIVYCNWKQLNDIHELYKKYTKKTLQREPRIGVWQKTNPSVFNMQRMAIQPYEFFIWLGVGKNMTFNNQRNGKPERLYFESATQRGYHPTLKNVKQLEHLVRTYTNEGDTVLDSCMGSGSTGVACMNTNRNFIGIELDEGYFNIAKNRIEETKSQQVVFV